MDTLTEDVAEECIGVVVGDCIKELNEETNKKDFKCEPCLFENSDVKASAFCMDCCEHLCINCARDHIKNKILRNHKILEGEGVPEQIKAIQDLKRMTVCTDHPETDFTYKCEDHDAYICIKCLPECHLKCNEVNEIQHLPFFGNADIICGAAKESLTQLQDYASTSIKETEENKETLRTSLSGVKTEQQNVFDKIYKQLSTAKADLDLETSRLFLKELNSLEKDLQQYKEVEEKGIQYRRLLEVTERFGNAMQLTVIPDLLSQKAKHLKGSIETNHHKEATRLTFDCCMDFNVLKNVGEVFVLSSGQEEHSKICDKYSLTSDEILEPVKIYSNTCHLSTENRSTQCRQTKYVDSNPNQLEHENFSNEQTKCDTTYTEQKQNPPYPMQRTINRRTSYTARCADDILPCNIISIVILPNERLICIDKNNMKLKVFEEDFTLSYAHYFQDGPKDMCHVDDTAVALIFYNVYEVGTYCVGQSCVSSEGKFQVPSRFRIKALAKSENKKTIAILLFENNNTIDNRIFVQIRDVDNGMILRSFVFEKYVCAKFDFRTDLFNRLLCKGTNEIIVSEYCKLHCFDIENSSATDFNKDTGSISIQGSWFYKIREGSFLNNITYVTADEKGNIYVCGSDSNNVHKIAAHDDGENKIVIPNIKEPLSVSANSKKGYLVVGCEQDDYLHVYHID